MSGRRTRSSRSKQSTRDAKADSSSSSESENSKALSVISKLSQKYMGQTRKGTKKKEKEKSPDIEYYGDEENSSGNSESNSLSSQKSAMSMFDFDEDDPIEMELSPPRNGKSKKVAVQKRNESRISKNSDSEAHKSQSGAKVSKTKKTASGETKGKRAKQPKILDISPIQPNNVTSGAVVIEDQIENKSRTNRKGQKSAKDKSVTFSPIVSDMNQLNLNNNRTPLVSLEKTDQNVMKQPAPINKLDLSMSLDQTDSVVHENSHGECRKRKQEVISKHDTSPAKVLKTSSTGSAKSQERAQKEKTKSKQTKRKDSGVFTSPNLVQKKLPMLVAKDTSTPTDGKTKHGFVPADDSTFGFGSIPSPMEVSPVNKVSEMTPLSDYASMDSSLHVLNNQEDMDRKRKKAKAPVQQKIELFMDQPDDDDEVSFNTSIQKCYKPKKKGLKKSSGKDPKVDDWMQKMNTEFSDIERFELSIEDV